MLITNGDTKTMITYIARAKIRLQSNQAEEALDDIVKVNCKKIVSQKSISSIYEKIIILKIISQKIFWPNTYPKRSWEQSPLAARRA